MNKDTKVLLGIISVVVIALVGLFVVFNKDGSSATTDVSRLVRSDSQREGSGSVTLVEFGDYQCPACGQAYPNVQKVMSEYSGKVQLVFRNYPLETIHKNALVGAKYAEAAAKQGKFWQFHDKLYEKQSEWSESNDPTSFFATYAKDLGLDGSKLKTDAASAEIASHITRDKADGDALAISGTPTFYVNGKQLANIDYASLKSAIDAALK